MKNIKLFIGSYVWVLTWQNIEGFTKTKTYWVDPVRKYYH